MTTVAGAVKKSKYTYEYKGFSFSYTAKRNSAFKVSLWINHFEKGYVLRRFTTIKDAVAYIDSVLADGGYFETSRNALAVVKVGA